MTDSSTIQSLWYFTKLKWYYNHDVNSICQISLNWIIKKRLQHRYFPMNIAKYLKTHFYRTRPVADFLGNYFPSLTTAVLADTDLQHYFKDT